MTMNPTAMSREALEQAYDFGFQASGEGWNGEYPAHDWQADPTYLRNRSEALTALRSHPATAGTPSPDALRQALSYLTPHALTKAPVVLQADELRQAVETISAALARPVVEEPGDAVEGEGWQTEDIRSLIDEAGVTFDSSEMIEKVSQYGGPGTLVGWHFSDPEDGVRKLSALIRLALRVRMSLAAAPKANGVGTGEVENARFASGLRPSDEAIAEAFHEHRRLAYPALPPWSDVEEGAGIWQYSHDFAARLASLPVATPSQTKPAALAAKPEGEKASAGEVWGVEDVGHSIWVGPMRPDGIEVDRIVYRQSLDNHQAEYVARAREDAHLIARSVNAALTTTTGSGGRAE